MNETLWEISYHRINDALSHCTVTPITVTRDGVLPGCSAATIDGIDVNGVRFTGSREMYFTTEEAAWAQVIQELEGTIALERESIAHYQRTLKEYETCLEKVKNERNTVTTRKNQNL